MTWTPKTAQRRTLRRIEAVRAKVYALCVEIACDWEDVNNYLVHQSEELNQQIDGHLDQIKEALKEVVEEEIAKAEETTRNSSGPDKAGP